MSGADVRLMLGDCLERMGEIADESVDLICADLPYGTTQAGFDVVIPFESLWPHYRRLLKLRGLAVLTASQPFTSMLVMSNPEWFRHEWIWIKNAGSNFGNTAREPMKEHESVLVFGRGGWSYNPQMQARAEGGKSRVRTPIKFDHRSENYGDFGPAFTKTMPELRVPSSWQKFNRERGLHPQQKPVALMEYLIRTYSNPGDLVLDNSCGSATTLIAAMNTDRRAIGIERDPVIFETARKRLAEHRASMPLLA